MLSYLTLALFAAKGKNSSSHLPAPHSSQLYDWKEQKNICVRYDLEPIYVATKSSNWIRLLLGTEFHHMWPNVCLCSGEES